MPSVAKYKWNHNIAVEDVAREQVILQSLAKRAQAAGVPPTLAERFFKDQIEAAKLIQNSLIAEWRSNNRPSFDNVPDLKAEIRPQLDTLTARLMNVLARFLHQPKQADHLTRLNAVPKIWASQPEAWQTAVRSLQLSTSR